MDQLVSELGQSYDIDKKLPGQPATQSVLAAGTPVFVLPLKKAGTVIKTGDDNTVEVKVGVIKLRVSSHDLRLLSAGEAAGGDTAKKSAKTVLGKSPREANNGTQSRAPLGTAGAGTQDATPEIGLTIQTTLNTLDLRGKDLDSALDELWNFLDRALMRGEEALVIIHGHGEGTLKAGVRTALRDKCPYDIRFRPGVDQEGGDGVTIVQLKI
jgi:DNA mismatch repair protein MutS2